MFDVWLCIDVCLLCLGVVVLWVLLTFVLSMLVAGAVFGVL